MRREGPRQAVWFCCIANEENSIGIARRLRLQVASLSLVASAAAVAALQFLICNAAMLMPGYLDTRLYLATNETPRAVHPLEMAAPNTNR